MQALQIKRLKLIFIPFFFLFHFNLLGQCGQPVWSDEFNGTSVDQTKWAFQTGNGCPDLCGWGNGELETYTNNNPKNVYLNNGILTLEAVRENVNGSSFTSAKLISLGKYSRTYGRFEARMRMPSGLGMWPAFWMLSVNNKWPMTGEIDIMEYRGDRPRETNSALHYGSLWPGNQYDASSYTYSQDLSSAFHVYAAEWEQNEIRFYFNNTLIKRETRNPNSLNPASNGNVWPWNSDFYIILNLAVGGGYAGNPSPAQVQLNKSTFEIDYVRVYSLPCTATGLDISSMNNDMLTVFPLPVDDNVYISLENTEMFRVIIKDLNGVSMGNYALRSGESIDVSSLTKGIYFLEINTGKTMLIKKLIKK